MNIVEQYLTASTDGGFDTFVMSKKWKYATFGSFNIVSVLFVLGAGICYCIMIQNANICEAYEKINTLYSILKLWNDCEMIALIGCYV